MVCNYGSHKPALNSCDVIADTFEEIVHIPNDIDFPDVEDLYPEDNSDSCEFCDVEFGKLVQKDFSSPTIYGDPVESDDASLDAQVEG